jgi:MarR family transcriptional regulator, organic hydroperoxide resistance regulator
MASPATPPEQRELIGDIIAQFRSAFGELRCIGSQRLLQRSVSPGHLHLLSMLERHGGMPMSRIAELLDVSLSATTGIVDRLEERGLVDRARLADDRRVVFVQVTKQGRRMLEDVEVLRSEMIRSILARLTPERLNALAETLGDLRRAVDEAAKAQPGLFAHHHQGDRAPGARAAHHSIEGTA